MKVLSMEEAQARLSAVCDEALTGEVIRLRLPNGTMVELKPVSPMPPLKAVSDDTLADCYADAEWAAFESHCGQASD